MRNKEKKQQKGRKVPRFYRGKTEKKNIPRDTQINASVNAQETHDQEARSPCGVNTEMEMQGEKRFPVS